MANKIVAPDVVALGEIPEGMSQTDAIRQGLATFTKSAQVPLRFGDGETYLVPAADALKEIQSGAASIYTAEEQAKDKVQAEYGDDNLLAAGLGAARTLTFGAIDVAAAALGFGEQVKGIREANPVASGVGEFGAALVPLAGQLGAASKIAQSATKLGAVVEAGATAAQIAGKPLRTLTNIADDVGSSVAKILSRVTGTQAGGAAIRGATAGMVEGAASGAGYLVGQSALEGADTVGEYLSAAAEGAATGGALGGLIGGSLPIAGEALSVAGRKTSNVFENIKDRAKSLVGEVNTETKAAKAAMNGEGTGILLDLNGKPFVAVKGADKVIDAVRNELKDLDLSVHPSQITDDPEIVGLYDKLLRSTATDSGLEAQTLLKQEALKVEQASAKLLDDAAGPYGNLDTEALGEQAQLSMIDFVNTKLGKFKDLYGALDEMGQKIQIDGADFASRFVRYAGRKDSIAANTLNVAETGSTRKYLGDIAGQSTVTGLRNVQKNIRKDIRSMSSKPSAVEGAARELTALNALDDYITDHMDNVAKIWEGDTPEAKRMMKPLYDVAKPILDDYIELTKKVNFDYAQAKKELEPLKSVFPLKDRDFISANALLDYFTAADAYTPTDVIKKIAKKDPAVLRAASEIPGLQPIIKAKLAEDLLNASKPGRNKGLQRLDGSEYVNVPTFRNKFRELPQEVRDVLFTPEQQRRAEALFTWNDAFEANKARVTPNRFLTESLRSEIDAAAGEGLAGVAGGVAGALATGNPVFAVAASVAGSFIQKVTRGSVSNLLTARQIRQLRGLTTEASDELAQTAGLVGAAKKSQKKIKNAVSNATQALFATKELRSAVIQTTKRDSRDNDQTADELFKEYKKTAEQLETVRGNEQGLLETVANDLNDITADTEVVGAFAAQQLKISQYLLAKMPQNPFGNSPSPVAKMWRPSDQQVREFMAVARAAQAPLSVIEDIKTGVVTPASIEAVQQLYPSIYNELVTTMRKKILETDKALTENQRAVAAIVLGGSFDESFDVSNQGAFRPAVSQPQPQPQQAGGAMPKSVRSSGVSKTKFAQAQQTQTERVIGR